MREYIEIERDYDLLKPLCSKAKRQYRSMKNSAKSLLESSGAEMLMAQFDENQKIKLFVMAKEEGSELS